MSKLETSKTKSRKYSAMPTRFSPHFPSMDKNTALGKAAAVTGFPVTVDEIVLVEGALDVYQAAVFNRYQVRAFTKAIAGLLFMIVPLFLWYTEARHMHGYVAPRPDKFSTEQLNSALKSANDIKMPEKLSQSLWEVITGWEQKTGRTHEWRVFWAGFLFLVSDILEWIFITKFHLSQTRDAHVKVGLFKLITDSWRVWLCIVAHALLVCVFFINSRYQPFNTTHAIKNLELNHGFRLSDHEIETLEWRMLHICDVVASEERPE